MDRIIVSNKSIARVVLRANVEKPKEGEFNADNFAWPAEGHGELQKPGLDAAHPNPSDPNAGKFARYPTLGSPNHAVAPFFFNIG